MHKYHFHNYAIDNGKTALICGLWSVMLLFTCLTSCTGFYFKSAEIRPPKTSPTPLSGLRFKEYWTGIVFNGDRIGFTHFKLTPSSDNPNRFDIYSEAYFNIRFLMFDKRINLIGHDTVAEDLTLLQFQYFFDLDGNHMTVYGQRVEDTLNVTATSKGQILKESIPIESPLFPTSVINLYPLVKGLEIGRHHTYWVFDGQTRSVSKVDQKILAYEESDLFRGPAYKIKTRLHGHDVTSWMDPSGKPLIEMSLGGVIITALENKNRAERYLTHAAINKHETFLDYSLIKTSTDLSHPRRTHALTLVISGFTGEFMPPNDARQQCFRAGEKINCSIRSLLDKSAKPSPNDRTADATRFLAPSYAIPSTNPIIRRVAHNITAQVKSNPLKIQMIMEWMDKHISKKPVDVFTALDVLETRQAECQGHAYLFAAFCRAEGIPTRIANGIVYSQRYQGFLYHTWAECYLEDVWMAVDPIFMQIPADATHIKFIEGESISSLLPLVDIIGKIKVQIIHYAATTPE